MASIPFEAQLDRLAECGIEFVSEQARAAALAEWGGPEPFEERPFEHLLSRIGSDFEDDRGQWRPSGIGVWRIDTECIYKAADYVAVVERLARLTRFDVRAEHVEAHFADQAWVRFDANGGHQHWELEVCDDWIDVAIFTRFAQLLRETDSDRRFYGSVSDGQDFLLICPTPEEFKRFTGLTETQYAPLVNG